MNDFSTLMRAMADMQEKVTGLSWDATNFASGSCLTIRIPCDPKTVELFEQGRAMFAPRED